jgi:hypothetical protein
MHETGSLPLHRDYHAEPCHLGPALLALFGESMPGAVETNTMIDRYADNEDGKGTSTEMVEGLVWLPHEGLLAGVSDTGAVFLVNPDTTSSDIDEYYLAEGVLDGTEYSNDFTDFEGVAFDPFLVADPDQRQPHLYVISEEPPALIQLDYTLPSNRGSHTLAVSVAQVVPLTDALPDFDDGKGLESLTLYRPSSATSNAEFFVGLQDNAIVYRMDSAGTAIGDPIDVGVFDTGISGSHYDPIHDTLYTVYDNQDGLAAIDVANNCVLATFETLGTQEEGLAIRHFNDGAGDDISNSIVYIASDEGGDDDDPSFIAEHVWFPNLPTSCNDNDDNDDNDDDPDDDDKDDDDDAPSSMPTTPTLTPNSSLPTVPSTSGCSQRNLRAGAVLIGLFVIVCSTSAQQQ